MNIKSEQITNDLKVIVDYDQPLKPIKLLEKTIEALETGRCRIISICEKKVLSYKKKDGNYVILLLSAVTYMGGNGQHPIFKKRSQLKGWYKDIVNFCKLNNSYEVRFIGVYHYNDNVVFMDYEKDTFITKKMNNSAVHVYINDIFQALNNGFFTRIDRNNNIIHAIRFNEFSKYLNNEIEMRNNDLFEMFKEFNSKIFKLGEWIRAEDAILEMYHNKWRNWRQTEWPGWFLEFKFNEFCKYKNCENIMNYVGSSNKSDGELDFDVWFERDNFFGDLKSSDIVTNESPGNDQENFIECISLYNKFWYIIYEHETVKDSVDEQYIATRFRSNFIKSVGAWPKHKPFDELSYHTRMKRSVRYIKMTIIELNSANYKSALSDFNQGHQPDGSPRNPKFKINKHNIENFIIFKQSVMN